MDTAVAQAFLDQNFAPWVLALQPRVTKLSETGAVLEIPITVEIARAGNIVSGQTLATLADTAMVIACGAVADEMLAVGTVTLDTQFLRPASGERIVERLRGRGSESEGELRRRLRAAEAELAADGHDLPNLVKTLRNLREHNGPQLLHIVTEKGKGYERAEQDPVSYHGVKPFDPATGKKLAGGGKPAGPTYTEVFGQWLCDVAERDERVVGITPAMREGSGLVEFEKRFPERYYDVGIAEQHAVTLAAGLACEGQRPVVAIYSTFLQRGYDQLVHDVAVQGLPVLFAIDRAGAVGEDGPTHFGSFDFSYMRCLPGLTLMAPADENECRQMLYTGLQLDGPSAVRYPKGPGPGVPVADEMSALEIGRAERRRSGQGIALLAFGSMVAPAAEVAEALDATLLNMRFVKPLDSDAVLEAAESHDLLVTLEENAVPGGAGEAVNACLAANRVSVTVHNIGLPDRFIGHGSRGDQLADARLDAESLLTDIRALLENAAQRRQRHA